MVNIALAEPVPRTYCVIELTLMLLIGQAAPLELLLV